MKRRCILLYLAIFFQLLSTSALANDAEQNREQVLQNRFYMYVKHATLEVPWYYLAAIDQFERNIQEVRRDIPPKKEPIALYFPAHLWSGLHNPNQEDRHLLTIAYFGGLGLDGDGDGYADLMNPDDSLSTLVHYLQAFMYQEEGYEKALQHLYGNQQSVHQIMTIAKIYAHFETNALDERAFPLPKTAHYTYRGTWGASRGWGGRRIHEGTDIFAAYGVPVRSTSYGIVEVKGWNEYGGWRIGIRDIHNTYHYYAHLAQDQQGLDEGDIVSPGDVIGYVGSSGYGKEGTVGRFPPHLHYGMYKFNGKVEWAFDPYPFLKKWEHNGLK